MRRYTLLLLWPAVVLAVEPSIQPALDAARRREEQFKTVSVRWRVSTFVPKGGRMDADPVGLPLPRVDQEVESRHRLVLDGDKMRGEHKDPGWRLQIPSAGDYDFAYDGERWFGRHFIEGRDRPAHLVIERPKEVGYEGGGALRPISLWCRRKAWAKLAETGPSARGVSDVDVDGNPCLSIRLGRPEMGLTTTYFVDPNRDCVVRRVTTQTRENTEVTDIEYRERPDAGWVPYEWTTVKTRANGNLMHRIRARVMDMRVNEPVPPERFRLDPLPGETVADHDTKKTYHVRADGSLEDAETVILPAEAPERLPRPPFVWPGRSLVRYVLLPALAMAILVGLILRRRRRPPDTPSP